MTAVRNIPATAQSWGIGDFFSKIHNLVSKIWQAVKNLLYSWMQFEPNPSSDETALRELENKVEQYKNLNRPLNDHEKADLKKKKEEVEQILKQAEERWNQAQVRERTPPWIQYKMSPIKDEFKRLFLR